MLEGKPVMIVKLPALGATGKWRAGWMGDNSALMRWRSVARLCWRILCHPKLLPRWLQKMLLLS